MTYRVLDTEPNGAGDNTEEYVVPAGHYFMMGDNRDNSQDSRFLDAVGYVPIENYVGRADIIFFSISPRCHALGSLEVALRHSLEPLLQPALSRLWSALPKPNTTPSASASAMSSRTANCCAMH